MRSCSSNGSARRTTASTTEKMAVLAPIPNVSTTKATTVTDIDERKERRAAFRSSRMAFSCGSGLVWATGHSTACKFCYFGTSKDRYGQPAEHSHSRGGWCPPNMSRQPAETVVDSRLNWPAPWRQHGRGTLECAVLRRNHCSTADGRKHKPHSGGSWGRPHANRRQSRSEYERSMEHGGRSVGMAIESLH